MALKKAIFLDKDGTLIENVPYNMDISRVKFFPGVIEGLQLLQNNGFILVVLTNQSGVAKGYSSMEELYEFIDNFNELLDKEGILLSGMYCCPHDGEKYFCTCRKPLPGLFSIAKEQLQLRLQSSWMIGDILHDVEAGNRAGCKTLLVNTGNETEWKSSLLRIPTLYATSFLEGVLEILQTR